MIRLGFKKCVRGKYEIVSTTDARNSRGWLPAITLVITIPSFPDFGSY